MVADFGFAALDLWEGVAQNVGLNPLAKTPEPEWLRTSKCEQLQAGSYRWW